MIQKNQCLFTNTQCKVCCALLISESQKLAHYQSKKHANKVKRYLAIHGMETLKGDTKKLDSDQKSSRSKDKNQCCPICNMTFSSPVVAQSHYLGKTHAKNLKLKQQSTKVEALHQNREMIDPDKFCSLCHATFNDPVMAQQHYMGKKHRKQETKLKLMAHYGRLADPAVTDSSAAKAHLCPWDSVVKETTLTQNISYCPDLHIPVSITGAMKMQHQTDSTMASRCKEALAQSHLCSSHNPGEVNTQMP
ncbi:zinc finger domain-containing protein, partial [Eschrichtius robustus]|nr:zinc finger domain-containing protein [Eschrichtius robustus]